MGFLLTPSGLSGQSLCKSVRICCSTCRNAWDSETCGIRVVFSSLCCRFFSLAFVSSLNLLPSGLWALSPVWSLSPVPTEPLPEVYLARFWVFWRLKELCKAKVLICHVLQVCEVLFSRATKYDELYQALTSLLAAGSQFDTLRRRENKNVTALVRLSYWLCWNLAVLLVCWGIMSFQT